jgi:hypothetical protein
VIIGPNVLSIKAIDNARKWMCVVIDNDEAISDPLPYLRARRRCAILQLDLAEYSSASIVYLDVGNEQYVLRAPDDVPEWYEIRVGTVEEVCIEG